MRKQLLGTTTLATLGILACGLTAGEAKAADPIQIEAGGFFMSVFQYIDQSDTTDLREFDLQTSGEMQFKGSTTLDNGLAVGVRIEYEAHNQGGGGTIVDERYLYLEGGFGQIKLGSDDNAAYSMHYQAPVAAWAVGLNSPSFAGLSGDGNAASSFISTYPFAGGDGNKIIYFSPRFSGVQLGASYQPDGVNSEGPQFNGTPNNDLGQQAEIIAFGANYSQAFDSVDVSASFGYTYSEPERDHDGGVRVLGIDDDREAFVLGLTFAFEGIAIGVAYKDDDNGGKHADTTVLDLGITYSTGPWVVGFNYGHLEQEVPNLAGAKLGEDELDGYAFTAQYSMGPGINVIAAIKYYDYDSDRVGTSDPDGAIVALGMAVSF